jgi:hypothetical protein
MRNVPLEAAEGVFALMMNSILLAKERYGTILALCDNF